MSFNAPVGAIFLMKSGGDQLLLVVVAGAIPPLTTIALPSIWWMLFAAAASNVPYATGLSGVKPLMMFGSFQISHWLTEPTTLATRALPTGAVTVYRGIDEPYVIARVLRRRVRRVYDALRQGIGTRPWRRPRDGEQDRDTEMRRGVDRVVDVDQLNVVALFGCAVHQLKSQRTRVTPSWAARYIAPNAATGPWVPHACGSGLRPVFGA